jgi:hypothetical protein
MRSICFGVIILLTSTAIVDTAHSEKDDYAQALISHRQPMQVSRDKLIRVDQGRPEEDALTKRIEQDRRRLDRLMEICPSC